MAKSEALKDLTDAELKALGLISPEESATGIIKLVAKSTREKDSGEFFSYDGSKPAW